MSNPPDGKLVRWLSLAGTISSLLIVPLLLWGLTIEKRVTLLEVQYFTQAEAAELLQDLNTHLVEQAAVNQRAEIGVDNNADDIAEWKEAIRDSVAQMNRFHSPTITSDLGGR